MRNENKKTYLFDFDGTLVDSMPTFVSVMLRILDEYGVSYGSDIVKIITPLGYEGTAQYFRALGISASAEELVAQMNEYAREAYATQIEAKDGVADTLAALKRRGARLNVLTASPHSVLDPCLKRLGLWSLFDRVWSCDDFKTTKANPAIYQMAANKIGQPVEEIVFVDDNINAVRTAKQAGMQAYGIYDLSSADLAADMRAVADRYVENFSELINSYFYQNNAKEETK